MATSRDLPADRLAIGQLLVRLLRQFRAELYAPAAEAGYRDLRQPHLHIFGNLGVDGVRLTELAARAQLSLAATSELVSELEHLGYLERRPDPADGRAKLIYPTPRGRQALDDAGDRVTEIEQHWAQLLGPARFADTCRTLQQLLDELTGQQPTQKP
jgi:DNA-binding MarR family transcriptional regulator